MKLGYLLAGIILSVLGSVVRIIDPAPLPELRDAYFDLLQKASPRPVYDSPIEIVAIDETSLAELGQWPWPRSVLADLTNTLNDAGAAVIAFDLLFAEHDRLSLGNLMKDSVYGETLRQSYGPDVLADLDSDQVFARAVSEIPTVFASSFTTQGAHSSRFEKAGFVTVGNPVSGAPWRIESATPVLPILLGPAEGVGIINTSPRDASGIVRRVPLVWRMGDQFVPSFSLEALRVALGESTYFLNGSPDLSDVLESVRVGEFVFPTTSAGEVWVRYAPENPDLYVSASDVLSADSDMLAERFVGKIVFVGATASGLFDIRSTPLGENVPGVSIHKQILEQVFYNQFLIRTEYQSGIEIILFVLLGLVVAVAISLRRSYVTLLSGLGAAGIVTVASYIGFVQQGVLLDVTFPLIGGLLNFALMSGYQFIVLDRDRRLMRRSFEHYVAPRVLDEIERAGHSVRLSGENKDITVMFADIRGFTSFSETRDPQHVVNVLNNLFSRFTLQILDANGTIDKYVGDAIMAFWSAPIELHNHAEQGLGTALKIRDELKRYNAELIDDNAPKLEIAIGLSTGMACVGNIGSRQRFSYTAIGQTVNLAARIETACRHVNYDILCSHETALGSGLACLPAGKLSLRGFAEPVPLYCVVGDHELARTDSFASLRQAHERFVSRLTSGSEHAASLQECLTLAQRIEPGLISFYHALPDRSHEL